MKEQLIASVSNLYGVSIDLDMAGRSVAAEIDSDAQRFMEEAIIDVLGKENLCPPVVTSGGEDFHHYTVKHPNIKATMLGLGCGLTPGLHHPHMSFNREAIMDGVHILTNVIIKTMKNLEV
ncbi:M20/M25/M40 family metallo-hydrolase [Evansella sp. AB-rgal1]|uniref:M20/M25/M40 family metallo-hydrolase n=1 Tax=Evansella sp. AB-rgal1 TaxID=3242696 RepID=UPI00359E91F7